MPAIVTIGSLVDAASSVNRPRFSPRPSLGSTEEPEELQALRDPFPSPLRRPLPPLWQPRRPMSLPPRPPPSLAGWGETWLDLAEAAGTILGSSSPLPSPVAGIKAFQSPPPPLNPVKALQDQVNQAAATAARQTKELVKTEVRQAVGTAQSKIDQAKSSILTTIVVVAAAAGGLYLYSRRAR